VQRHAAEVRVVMLVATFVAAEPQHSSALVVVEEGEEPVALQVGDKLEGKEVVSIEEDRIELRSGDRVSELVMEP
jgi:predicted LPLAT superfamily acyltransferase